MSAPSPALDHTDSHVVHLPAPARVLRFAAAHLLEGTVLPIAVFYAVLAAAGLRWALVAGLGWCYASVARRLLSRQPVPGLLVLGTALFTVRSLIALATGSTFVYFLQPTLGTFLVAGLFLVSVGLGRPLAERLAHDFCPLPDNLLANGRIRAFFHHISLLWAAVYVVNGATTLTFLLTASIGKFLVLKTVASTASTALATLGSFAWFRRSLANEGMVLRWARAGRN